MNTWVELDESILAENIRGLKSTISNETQVMFVVKANAYGHGMIPVAKTAWREGVRSFAVAHIDEAQVLRETLPEADILIVGVLPPSDARDAISCRVSTVIVSPAHAESLSRAAVSAGGVLSCHAKIDTGMGRVGFPWASAATDLASCAGKNGIRLTGICTHFASSDSPRRTFADIQSERFDRVLRQCEKAGIDFPFKHASNSGAILLEPRWDFNAVRAGILLYGYARTSSCPPTPRVRTQPFLQWKTRVLQVKEVPGGFPVSYDGTYMTPDKTILATIDVGYADGFSRALSNKGMVLIGGKRCPVAGRVTMNLTVVDVGPDASVREGDEVVLIGAQGSSSIWADEVAGWCNTIPYEILTNIRTTDRRTRT